MEHTRYEKALENLKTITGVSKEAVIENLKGFPFEFSDWIIEFAYGDVLDPVRNFH